jgi:hypothetical protein
MNRQQRRQHLHRQQILLSPARISARRAQVALLVRRLEAMTPDQRRTAMNKAAAAHARAERRAGRRA